VEFADAKGPRVAIITLADAVDIYELRCVLEGLIVQLFTLNAKAKDIRALEKALEVNREGPQEGELQQVLDSVQGFYDVLLEGSGNHVAASSCASCRRASATCALPRCRRKTAAAPATAKWKRSSRRSRAATRWWPTRPASTTSAPPPRWPWITCARTG
jgi:DNA-binding GntR family transcriptional regulator